MVKNTYKTPVIFHKFSFFAILQQFSENSPTLNDIYTPIEYLIRLYLHFQYGIIKIVKKFY